MGGKSSKRTTFLGGGEVMTWLEVAHVTGCFWWVDMHHFDIEAQWEVGETGPSLITLQHTTSVIGYLGCYSGLVAG